MRQTPLNIVIRGQIQMRQTPLNIMRGQTHLSLTPARCGKIYPSDVPSAAWAAARRAIGILNGEQDT